MLRPSRRDLPAPAFADPEKCEGCEQGFNDCPYDANEMVAGQHPETPPLAADAQAGRCTSCGLCAGSCASLAIGPPGQTAGHQLAAARQLVASQADAAGRTLLIVCGNNGSLAERLRRSFALDRQLAWFSVDCAG